MEFLRPRPGAEPGSVWHILRDEKTYCGREQTPNYELTEEKPHRETLICWVCRRAWERVHGKVFRL